MHQNYGQKCENPKICIGSILEHPDFNMNIFMILNYFNTAQNCINKKNIYI